MNPWQEIKEKVESSSIVQIEGGYALSCDVEDIYKGSELLRKHFIFKTKEECEKFKEHFIKNGPFINF